MNTNKITINILKSSLLNEIGKLTAYVGAKNTDEKGVNTYDQVFTTNDDSILLERFWRESKSDITNKLSRYIIVPEEAITITDDDVDPEEQFQLTISLPENYNTSLLAPLNDEIYNYMANMIVSRWFGITNRGDEERYLNYASRSLEKIHSYLLRRNSLLIRKLSPF